MKHVVPHDLKDRARAREVVAKALESYQERLRQYNPTVRWESDDRAIISFEVMSKTLSATLEVDDDDITFESKVPLLLRPFQGKAIEVLDREVRHWIGKAKAGEI